MAMKSSEMKKCCAGFMHLSQVEIFFPDPFSECEMSIEECRKNKLSLLIPLVSLSFNQPQFGETPSYKYFDPPFSCKPDALYPSY